MVLINYYGLVLTAHRPPLVIVTPNSRSCAIRLQSRAGESEGFALAGHPLGAGREVLQRDDMHGVEIISVTVGVRNDDFPGVTVTHSV